ncbi:MAG: helix-turn-helix domain-containing protein [Pseudomonadota bacterium]
MCDGTPARRRYQAAFADQARLLCRLGATQEDLAAFFGIGEGQLDHWRRRHPAFDEAVSTSSEAADACVERSLFQRAVGYSHPEDRIFANGGNPVVVPTTKHYPPDTTAIMFWLKNRRPDLWREKHEHAVLGSMGGTIRIEFVPAAEGSDGDDQGS